MTIKIDKNVPMPSRRAGSLRYPWSEMVVGDSFFVKANDKGQQTNLILQSATQWMRRTGSTYKFSTRKVIEKGVAGIRVWRVE